MDFYLDVGPRPSWRHLLLRDDPDAPELVLSSMLTAYGEAVRAHTANLPPKEAGYIRLTFWLAPGRF